MAVENDGRSAVGADDSTRKINRLRRQVTTSCGLAAVVLVDHYIPLGDFEITIEWAEKILAGAVFFDVALRPVLFFLLPTRIVFQYDRRRQQ